MKKLSEFKNDEMEKSMFKTIFGGKEMMTTVRGSYNTKDYWNDADNSGTINKGDTLMYWTDHSIVPSNGDLT